MKTIQNVTPETCIIRNTAARRGRTRSVMPGSTAARHLHYGRIILDPNDKPISFDTAGLETGLVCLGGGATITIDGSRYDLGRFDSMECRLRRCELVSLDRHHAGAWKKRRRVHPGSDSVRETGRRTCQRGSELSEEAVDRERCTADHAIARSTCRRRDCK